MQVNSIVVNNSPVFKASQGLPGPGPGPPGFKGSIEIFFKFHDIIFLNKTRIIFLKILISRILK